jgi:FG-GAP-like repeat
MRMRALIKMVLLVIAIVIPSIAAAANPMVAIHASTPSGGSYWSAIGWKPYHPNQFLKESFRSDGTPFIELSDAQIASGILLENGAPRYPILFSLNAELISDSTANSIQTYVQAGGHVYVSGSSWTRRETGAIRRDSVGKPMFALGPQMGLQPIGWGYSSNVIMQQPSSAIDHLDIGIPYPWHIAAAYDQVSLTPARRIFGVMPAASAPASTLLAAVMDGPLFNESISGGITVDSSAWQGNGAGLRYANVDGDPIGRQDMIYRVNGWIYVRLATELGYSTPMIWTSWNPAYDYQVADVSGDGKADLIGRYGSDIQVAISSGAGFYPSTAWTYWNPSYDYRLADVNGDGRADLVGRSGYDVQVSLSTGSNFPASTFWTNWAPSYDLRLADVNGDGKADIVGRCGTDIQAGMSTGTSFMMSTAWTYWGANYDYRLADVNGDRRADIVGRSGINIEVGVSNGLYFTPSTRWTTWSTDFNFNLVDFDGDGKSDIVGCKCNATPFPFFSPFPSGDIQIGISSAFPPGVNVDSFVKLARKQLGAGTFIYNADVNPLAGNGGFSNDNSEYKIIRRSIQDAFASNQVPLTTLAPWPFPNRSAMIYRHDHWLARDIHEKEIDLAPTADAFGEYYVMPNQAGFSNNCPSFSNATNDYLAAAFWATDNRALIGAHNIGHELLELPNKEAPAQARARADRLLTAVRDRIQYETNGRMSPIYVAPAYFALQKTSLEAIWSAGFKTTGEQGVGPFPHFAFDPEIPDGRIGALLELPTSEWPGYDNVERMIVAGPASTYQDIPILKKAASLSYQMGGLINVYDHAAGDPYGYSQAGINNCDYSRKVIAENLLHYVSETLDNPSQRRIWYTNSIDIRNWWLQRNSRQPSFFIQRTTQGTIVDVFIKIENPIDTTPISAEKLGIRMTFDRASRAHAQNRIRLYTDGVLREDIPGCRDSSRIRCSAQDSDLYALVGSTTNARIVLGNP